MNPRTVATKSVPTVWAQSSKISDRASIRCVSTAKSENPGKFRICIEIFQNFYFRYVLMKQWLAPASNGIQSPANGMPPGGNGMPPGSNGMPPGANGMPPGSNGIQVLHQEIWKHYWMSLRGAQIQFYFVTQIQATAAPQGLKIPDTVKTR